ncbi:MAG: DUF6088 family protein [Candidatus Udaeobacter sp.]
MNRSRDESIATKVKKRITRRPDKTIWSFADFSDLDPTAVAAALSRLAKHGDLHRVRRGIYHHPRNTAFGASRPDPAVVAETMFRNRRSVPIRGHNHLGLTTQVSNEITRAVDWPTRVKPIRGVNIRTVTRPLSRQKGINESERAALDALRSLRRIPDTTTVDTLRRIKSLIRTGILEPARLARFASAEPPRVRALVGALVESAGCRNSAIDALRTSLNPLTTYRIRGIHQVLPNAATWHVK